MKLFTILVLVAFSLSSYAEVKWDDNLNLADTEWSHPPDSEWLAASTKKLIFKELEFKLIKGSLGLAMWEYDNQGAVKYSVKPKSTKKTYAGFYSTKKVGSNIVFDFILMTNK